MKQVNERNLVHDVLERGYLMSLASLDEAGPWVSDIIYVADRGLNIYFVSRVEFRHSKAFEKNPTASLSITAVEKPEGQSTGIQTSGTVKRVDSVSPEVMSAYAMKRGGKVTWMLAAGEAWYQFSPEHIDLIYEPLFGFTKKHVTLT